MLYQINLSVDNLHLLIKLTNPGKVKEKFAAWAELQDEVELRLILESICQLDDKGVLDVFLNKNYDN